MPIFDGQQKDRPRRRTWSERQAFVDLRKAERARAVESLKQREVEEREEREKERIRNGGDPDDVFEPKQRHALRHKVLSVFKPSSSGELSTQGTKKQLDEAARQQEQRDRDSQRDHLGEWLAGVDEHRPEEDTRRRASAEKPRPQSGTSSGVATSWWRTRETEEAGDRRASRWN
ncbi:hypothetical protein JCM8208_001420 [Rhodotorula glutinis]